MTTSTAWSRMPRSKLIVVGASLEPLEIDIGQLITGTKSIQGESVGTAIDEEDTLAFSALESIHPTIELVPLENAPEASARMMRNDARFSIVLTFGSSV